MSWEAIATLSSAVSAAVVVIAAGYTHKQLGEARRARSAQVLLEFRKLHTSPRSVETRERLMKGEFEDIAQISADDRRSLEEVVDEQELLALLVHHGLLDKEVARDFFRYSPTQVWNASKPFILEVRRAHRGYGEYLEEYVERKSWLREVLQRILPTT